MFYYTHNNHPQQTAQISFYMDRSSELTKEFGMLMRLMMDKAYGSGITITRYEVMPIKLLNGKELNLLYNFYDEDTDRYESTLQVLPFCAHIELLKKFLHDRSTDEATKG